MYVCKQNPLSHSKEAMAKLEGREEGRETTHAPEGKSDYGAN
jgi:hypothetical protein